MFDSFIKNLGLTPESTKIIGHFYYRTSMGLSANQNSNLNEWQIILKEYQTNAMEIEFKSVDESQIFFVAQFPRTTEEYVIYILKDKSLDDYVLSINNENAFLERVMDKKGFLYTKVSFETKKEGKVKIENKEKKNEETNFDVIEDELVIYTQEYTSVGVPWEITSDGGKKGVIDRVNKNFIINPQYDDILYDDYSDIGIGRTGEVHFECFITYNGPKPDIKNYYILQKGYLFHYFKADGMEGIRKDGNTFIQFAIGRKNGFCNEKGQIIIKRQFDEVGRLSHDNTGVITWGLKNSKYFGINLISREIKSINIPENYKIVSPFSNDVAAINNEQGMVGLIDRNGKTIFPCVLDYEPDFVNETAVVKSNGLFGIFNNKGETIARCRYDAISEIYQDIYITVLDEKYGIVTENGDFLFKNTYDEIIDISNRNEISFRIAKDDKVSYIDSKGNYLSKELYDYTKPYEGNVGFYGGLLRVKKNGLYGFVNSEFEEVITCRYQKASIFEQGQAMVLKNGKKSFINAKGKAATTEDIYDNMDYLSYKSNSEYVFEEEENIQDGIIDG